MSGFDIMAKRPGTIGTGLSDDDGASDALFAEAMENSSEAIVIYDAEGLLVACNRNFRELYGYSEQEASPGVHFAELGRIDMARGNVVVGDEIGGGDAYLNRKAEYRRQLQGSFIVQMKDGRWIKTTDRPMRRGGFVSIQVDVTDIKRSEQELKEAKERAETASRQKSEFLANISHDLRTPLNSVIGFSDMILNQTWGPVGHEKYIEYAESIRHSGNLLLSLVGDILDTAKMESGGFEITLTPIDPVSLSAEIIRHLEPEIAKRQLQIDLRAADEFPSRVQADQRAVTQILNNLLSNACKHTPAGGKIAVEWDTGENDHIRLSVVDTGGGMPAGIAERIGEPFLHDAAYVTSGERGTGLGLYICAKLAEAMGGKIKANAEADAGTTVTLTWPMTPAGGPRTSAGTTYPLHW